MYDRWKSSRLWVHGVMRIEISRRDNPGCGRCSSDKDEAELAVRVTAALASSRRHLPSTAAAGRRGRIPASLTADDPVTTATVTETTSHGDRLTLDARYGAFYQRSCPRSGRGWWLASTFSVNHFILRTVSVDYSNINGRVYKEASGLHLNASDYRTTHYQSGQRGQVQSGFAAYLL